MAKTTQTQAQASEKKAKAPKAPDVTFPDFNDANTYVASLRQLKGAFDNDTSAFVRAAVVRAAVAIVRNGEKAAKKADRDATRLRKKLRKLAEESKKAGIDITTLMG